MKRPRPIKEFCDCGSSIVLYGTDDEGDGMILEAWRVRHDGRGHGLITPAEAKRRRAEVHHRG